MRVIEQTSFPARFIRKFLVTAISRKRIASRQGFRPKFHILRDLYNSSGNQRKGKPMQFAGGKHENVEYSTYSTDYAACYSSYGGIAISNGTNSSQKARISTRDTNSENDVSGRNVACYLQIRSRHCLTKGHAKPLTQECTMKVTGSGAQCLEH